MTTTVTSIDKSKLLGFISKYYLGGNTDSAKLVIEDGSLSTKFISSDQNVIGDVVLKNFNAQEGELGVYTTSQLIKLLTAVDEKIDVSFNEVNKKVYSINFKDSTTNVTYMLADLSVIRQVPNLKSLPDFEVQIQLDKEFANNFKKAANALPEADNFGVESTDTGTRIIINYSKINTNRIVFDVKTQASEPMDVVCFSAKLFKEILNSNSESTGLLEVSSKGLARVTFTNNDYSCTYYLVKLTVS